MTDIRHELPREHWCETRDPWETTESDLRLVRPERAPKASQPKGGLAGVAPQLAVVRDEEDDETPDPEGDARAWRNIGKVVHAWGGPLLDGKPVDAETGRSLPLPLRNAVFRVYAQFWQELRGEVPTTAP